MNENRFMSRTPISEKFNFAVHSYVYMELPYGRDVALMYLRFISQVYHSQRPLLIVIQFLTFRGFRELCGLVVRPPDCHDAGRCLSRIKTTYFQKYFREILNAKVMSYKSMTQIISYIFSIWQLHINLAVHRKIDFRLEE